MTIIDYLMFLGFGSSALIVFTIWMRYLAARSLLRQPAVRLLLNGRERLDSEQFVGQQLQAICRRDPTTRQRFLEAYLATVPQLAPELRERLHDDWEWTERCLCHAIRELDDGALVALAAQTCLAEGNPWRTRAEQRAARAEATAWPTRLVILLGALTLLCMLLCPPWVTQRLRRTRVIGLGESVRVLSHQSAGYHWLMHPMPPAEIDYWRGQDLRRLRYDETRRQIDYPRIYLQVAALTLACAVLICCSDRRCLRAFCSTQCSPSIDPLSRSADRTARDLHRGPRTDACPSKER